MCHLFHFKQAWGKTSLLHYCHKGKILDASLQEIINYIFTAWSTITAWSSIILKQRENLGIFFLFSSWNKLEAKHLHNLTSQT